MAEDRYNFSTSSGMSIVSKVLEEDSYSQIKFVLLGLTGARTFSQRPASVVERKGKKRSSLLKSVTWISLFQLACDLCKWQSASVHC